MSNSYLTIPYENAVMFLSGVNEDLLTPYYTQYDVSDVSSLAEIISDADLIALGYENPSVPKIETVDESEYHSSYDDVINFLETLDKYTLEELMYRYNTNRLEDLAVAMTDYELASLGFNAEDKLHSRGVDAEPVHTDMNSDMILTDKAIEYSENLDYLEDVSDVNYNILDEDNHIFGVKDELAFNHFKEALDPNLVELCEPIQEDLGLDCYAFQVTPRNYPVQEEVIINDKLNPLIFDENNKIHEDVKNNLLNYVQAFIDKANNLDIDLGYSDIVLAGSNAGYLYTPESDVDVHIVSAEPINEDVFDKLKEEFDLFEAENPLVIKDENGNEHKVELGIEDGYNIVMDNKDARRYSLLEDNWVDDSDKFEVYTSADLSAVEGYEDVVEEYVNKINEVVDSDDYASAKALKQELRQNRSTDLANIGALSMGNVVFKELRNNGAYGKLREYLKSKEAVM